MEQIIEKHFYNRQDLKQLKFDLQDDIQQFLIQLQSQMDQEQQIIIDQQAAKIEELIKIRKEDKEKYRNQYESLRTKGQDKIHRLKDKIVEYQTNFQTLQLEMQQLKRLLFEEQQQKIRLQDKYEQQIAQMNDDFQMNFKKKETELKKEMLTIQKDLTSKIEQLTSYKLSQEGFQGINYQKQNFIERQIEMIENQFLKEKNELEQMISKQSQIIQMMSQEHEKAIHHYLEEKNRKSDDTKSTHTIKLFQIANKTSRIQLYKLCKLLLEMIKEVKLIKEQLKKYIFSIFFDASNFLEGTKIKKSKSPKQTKTHSIYSPSNHYQKHLEQLIQHQQKTQASNNSNKNGQKHYYFLQGITNMYNYINTDPKKGKLQEKLESAMPNKKGQTRQSFEQIGPQSLHQRKYSDVSSNYQFTNYVQALSKNAQILTSNLINTQRNKKVSTSSDKVVNKQK